MSEFFRFEDENIDFPFYNGKPKLSLFEWSLLVLGLVIFILDLIIPIEIPQSISSIILCLALLIPTLHVCKRNYSLFFRKPKLKDIKLVILCLIGYYMYTVIIVSIFLSINFETNPNTILYVTMDLMFWITAFIQLMGEELFKVLILIIVMAIVYYLTKNRKLSMICGIIMALTAFGLIHYSAYGNLIQIMIIQGLGSLFNLFTYLKTKNVVVSYIMHVITDAIPFLMVTIMQMNGMTINDL